MVKTMNSVAMYSLLSLPQEPEGEKTLVSKVELDKLTHMPQQYGHLCWPKDEIIKYDLLMHNNRLLLFGNFYCETFNYFTYL